MREIWQHGYLTIKEGRMRKHDKHTSASEKKIAETKKFDSLQKVRMTDKQRKNWERKPYNYGGQR